MSEYDHEPVRGLPEELPEDEYMIWQDAPDWKRMVASALHIRLALLYFSIIAGTALLGGNPGTAGVMVLFAIAVTSFFALYAYGVGRTCVYTLTNKRIVMRVGVALNKCINIPLSEIETANLKLTGGGAGNIVLSLKGMPRMGYTMLWPHARSLRLVRPQPMLRAVPDAAKVARLLFEATVLVQPVTKKAEAAPEPAMEGLTA
ncbi:photosynthetic complex putative assembly protein PuhB [Erythrobacter sp. W53]|uniref:photosynthetic complex putative assembly protein PuhB n=1 Tax=Erythrobacter sp. W53 TaxID=3425947 RepID=UPI003D768E8B